MAYPLISRTTCVLMAANLYMKLAYFSSSKSHFPDNVFRRDRWRISMLRKPLHYWKSIWSHEMSDKFNKIMDFVRTFAWTSAEALCQLILKSGQRTYGVWLFCYFVKCRTWSHSATIPRTKWKLYASLNDKVSQHKTVLSERDGVLKSLRDRLVRDSGNVLGGQGSSKGMDEGSIAKKWLLNSGTAPLINFNFLVNFISFDKFYHSDKFYYFDKF